MRLQVLFLTAIAGICLAGCSAFHSLSLVQKSPRDAYFTALQKTELAKSVMGRDWTKAGDPVSHDSLRIPLPYRESGFFPASEPQARFYRFEAKEGQVATLTVKIRSREMSRVFVDLFVLDASVWKNVAWCDTVLNLSYELPKDQSCLIRLQPELLATIYYAVEISTTPALIIPVKGATNKSIGSFYNDPRDVGGKTRKHEGVDIFAPKGTPVIAPVDGYVSRVGTNTLGGKVVWMNDPKRGHSYYFAHLDSQIAVPGLRVKQGDILGLVGNTGNAKFTPSHLHFGVYQQTSKDPLAYLKTAEILSGSFEPDTLMKSIIVRVAQKGAGLQWQPEKKSRIRQTLPKDSWLKILGQTDSYYRVATADAREGFVGRGNVMSAEKGNQVILKKPAELLTEARRDAVPQQTIRGTVQALALWKTFRYVRTSTGLTGWIDLAQAF